MEPNENRKTTKAIVHIAYNKTPKSSQALENIKLQKQINNQKKYKKATSE